MHIDSGTTEHCLSPFAQHRAVFVSFFPAFSLKMYWKILQDRLCFCNFPSFHILLHHNPLLAGAYIQNPIHGTDKYFDRRPRLQSPAYPRYEPSAPESAQIHFRPYPALHL